MTDPDLPPETVPPPSGVGLDPVLGGPVPADPGATTLPSAPAAPAWLQALGEMLLCSSVATQLAIGWTLQKTGWLPVNDQGELQLGFITALTLLDTVALVGLMVWLMRLHGERPAALWVGSRFPPREVLTGVLHLPVVFMIGASLLLTIRAFTPDLHDVKVNPFEALAGDRLQDAAMLTLVAIVAGGVREELQRAFLLDRFERHLGPAWLGVVLLSIAFGLGHLVQGTDAAIATGAMGAFWAVVYLRRRSSVAPIVSHALFNALQVATIVAMNR